MAIIGMAIFSTEENKKDLCLERTLESLKQTVSFSRHRLQISVNGETPETLRILHIYRDIIENIIYNDKNLGTAEAINKVWRYRKDGENAIKMDDDIVIHQEGWIDLMEEAIRRAPEIGQIGLKRKDCWENPSHENPFYQSLLIMLPHRAGERWIAVEKVNHVMGSCVMHSSALLDEVGYLKQPDLYGFDDAYMSLRSQVKGFLNCFLPQIEIDHIDDGSTPYQKWKEDHAAKCWDEYYKVIKGYQDGSLSVYYNPYKHG